MFCPRKLCAPIDTCDTRNDVLEKSALMIDSPSEPWCRCRRPPGTGSRAGDLGAEVRAGLLGVRQAVPEPAQVVDDVRAVAEQLREELDVGQPDDRPGGSSSAGRTADTRVRTHGEVSSRGTTVNTTARPTTTKPKNSTAEITQRLDVEGADGGVRVSPVEPPAMAGTSVNTSRCRRPPAACTPAVRPAARWPVRSRRAAALPQFLSLDPPVLHVGALRRGTVPVLAGRYRLRRPGGRRRGPVARSHPSRC